MATPIREIASAPKRVDPLWTSRITLPIAGPHEA